MRTKSLVQKLDLNEKNGIWILEILEFLRLEEISFLCWRSNPEPQACNASALSPTYTPPPPVLIKALKKHSILPLHFRETKALSVN